MVWFNGRKIAVAATVAAVIVRFDTTPSYAIDVFGVLGGSSGGSSVGSSGGFSISLSLGSHGGSSGCSSGCSSGGFGHRTPAGYWTAYGAPVAPVQGFVPVPVRAVALSASAGPPDPAPKWARPPGTVPVIAIAAPAPRWVNPSALSATHNAANMRAVPYQAVPAQQAMPMPAAPGQVVYPHGLQNGIQLQQYQVAQATSPNQPAVPADPGIFNGQAGAAPQANAPQQIVPLQPAQQPLAVPPAGLQPGFAPQMVAPQGVPLQQQYAAPQYGQAQPMRAYAGPALPIQQVPQGVTPYGQAPPQPVPAGPINPPSSVSTVYGYSDTGARPPGTLGKTYMRPTRMIDWDKHPRIGMLDVEIIDTLRAGLAADVKIKVTARDTYNHFKPLEGFRGDDGVWHFESDPLLPTVPNIYDVKFTLVREQTVFEKRYGRVFEKTIEQNLGSLGTQRVRLIPGRIVDLVYY